MVIVVSFKFFIIISGFFSVETVKSMGEILV